MVNLEDRILMSQIFARGINRQHRKRGIKVPDGYLLDLFKDTARQYILRKMFSVVVR